eukprot:227358_1
MTLTVGEGSPWYYGFGSPELGDVMSTHFLWFCKLSVMWCMIAVTLWMVVLRPTIAYYQLRVQAGLPTKWWRPKFLRMDISMQKGKSLDNVVKYMEKMGGPLEMYGTVYGASALVHVGDPTAAKAVLQSATKSPGYHHFKSFCGNGVFTADGREWEAKRRSIVHAMLRRERMNEWPQLVNEVADDLETEIILHTTSSDYVNEEGVKALPLLQRTSLNLIHQFLVGEDAIKSPELAQLVDPYIRAVMEIRLVILAKSRSIWFFLSDWLYRNFSLLYKRHEVCMNVIRLFSWLALSTTDQYQNTEELPTGVALHCDNDQQRSGTFESDTANVKSAYFSSIETPIQEISKCTSHRSVSDILDESITLHFAGSDTASATLGWILSIISRAKQAPLRRRLKEEVVGVCGQEGHIPVSALPKMKLLNAVVKETLRLYPVAPFVVRKLHKEVVIRKRNSSGELEQKCVLPAGVLCMVWIYALHRREKFWGRPTEFLPERWIDPGTKYIHTPDAFMPFASGPRACLGQAIAEQFLHLMLARICRRWDVRCPPHAPETLTMEAGFTVIPADGLKLQFVEWCN